VRRGEPGATGPPLRFREYRKEINSMTRSKALVRLGGATGAVVLSLALSACGDTSAPAATGSAPAASSAAEAGQQFNDADVQFAQMMIPHHRQAVQMAELASERAQSPDVKALAEQIKGAQDPEIATLTGFLEDWGAEVPAEDAMGGMEGMDHSGMSGMMTPEQLTELSNASGAEFDRMFLEMMVGHHQSAVSEAEREQSEGVNPEAKALAGEIAKTQSEEISRMQELLQAL
jgi:uncharacterized protein (DUF305 family)